MFAADSESTSSTLKFAKTFLAVPNAFTGSMTIMPKPSFDIQ
jgi:hypothetical protein